MTMMARHGHGHGIKLIYNCIHFLFIYNISTINYMIIFMYTKCSNSHTIIMTYGYGYAIEYNGHTLERAFAFAFDLLHSLAWARAWACQPAMTIYWFDLPYYNICILHYLAISDVNNIHCTKHNIIYIPVDNRRLDVQWNI